MLSIINDIIKEGTIDNISSIKILNNQIIDEIRIITNENPLLIYNKMNILRYDLQIVSISTNTIIFTINKIYTITLTNKNDDLKKININNIQIDLKTNNILNDCNEINVIYDDINNYPIILLEIIELLCYEKYTINSKLKNFIDTNIVEISKNFQYYMMNRLNDIVTIMNNIENRKQYSVFIKLITGDYLNIYEIIFGIKYNKNLYNIIKPYDIKTLFLFILIDKEKLFDQKKKFTYNEDILSKLDNSDDDDTFDIGYTNYSIKLDKINDMKKIKLEIVKLESYIKKYYFEQSKYYFIITAYNILKILTIPDIELSLKIGYVIKNFLNVDIEVYKYCVNLYNTLLTQEINDKIYEILNNTEFIKYIEIKHLEIPKIVYNFKNNSDSIDIHEFQDCFVLLCEDVYINNNKNYDVIFENKLNCIRDHKKDYVYKSQYESEKEKYKKLKNVYEFIKKNKKIL